MDARFGRQQAVRVVAGHRQRDALQPVLRIRLVSECAVPGYFACRIVTEVLGPHCRVAVGSGIRWWLRARLVRDFMESGLIHGHKAADLSGRSALA